MDKNDIFAGISAVACLWAAGYTCWFFWNENKRNRERHLKMMDQMEWAFDVQKTEYMEHRNGMN